MAAPQFAKHRWLIRRNDGGDSSKDQSEKIIARIFSSLGVPHPSPHPSSPLLRLIDQQRMALEYCYRKKHFSSQPSFAAIHRWSIRHNDGGDYSVAKSDEYFLSTLLLLLFRTNLHSFPRRCCVLLTNNEWHLNTVTEKSISSSQPSFAAMHRWPIIRNGGKDYSKAKCNNFF